MSDDVKPYKAIADLLNDSERIQAALRLNADALARAVLGTIRHAPAHLVRDLKRELKNFDSKKRVWK